MSLKAAIFDIDGTLVDSMELWHSLGTRFCAYNGLLPVHNINKLLLKNSLSSITEELKKIYPAYGARNIRHDLASVITAFYKSGPSETVSKVASLITELTDYSR